MNYPEKFICATTEYSTLDDHIPAPFFRKSFVSDAAATAHIIISACGFYDLYLNGKKVTKGALAPYISNPNHIVYYDEYFLPLNKGENVIGVWLGNGFQNNPGGYIWDFDKTNFRSAPKFALSVKWKNADGNDEFFESDESFLTSSSPIVFDDYRFGEHYDATLEKNGWNDTGFDDSLWTNALIAPTPIGEKRICEADPIVVTKEVKPVAIVKEDDGFRYDFGKNYAGVCRLSVRAKPGQEIRLVHVERVIDDKISFDGLWFDRSEEQYKHDLEIIHTDVYKCKGEGEEVYIPRFTYHGFRYVLVKGITEEQATPELLTYLVMNSDLKERGGFSCSDETVNKLQDMTRISDLANFYYFPTDCPHREKNGWTADAALSCEHVLMNLSAEKSYREWMRNICKAQDDSGKIPGIVPTGDWGYDWCSGPAWDSVLVWIPYFSYIYTGDTAMITESAKTIMTYLHYLTTITDEKGLIKVGLGDWCPVNKRAGDYDSPLEFTTTVIAYDLAKKSAFMFDKVGMTFQRDFAEAFAFQLKKSVRENLIDYGTMTAAGNCQTSQSMALFYEIFEENEKEKALAKLIEFIEAKNNHFDTGVLGGRVIFHVLAQNGYCDLALKMIVGPEFPSYGDWIKRDATALWEHFYEDVSDVSSMNHHFWGDISSWFIQYLAGIRMNPDRNNADSADIAPCFVSTLDFAEGFHIAPAGKVSSSWVRKDGKIILTVEAPEKISGRIRLPDGNVFDDGGNEKTLVSGEFVVVEK